MSFKVLYNNAKEVPSWVPWASEKESKTVIRLVMEL